MNFIWKNFQSISILIFLIGLLFLPGKIFAQETASFFLSPSSGEYEVNDIVSIDLRINTSAAVTSVKAYLDFDTSTISISNIDTTGSVFSNVWENAFDDITGKIMLQVSTNAPGYIGTNGFIAKINFQAINAGSATITYDSSSLALKPDDTNIFNLGSSTGASFTIVEAPAPPPGSSDTTPPTRSNRKPTTTLSAGSTQTTISLNTDEAATCKFSTQINQGYDAMSNTFSNTGSTYHSILLTSLSDGTSYTYFVRCSDILGNKNTNDYTIQFSITSAPSPEPPAADGDNESPPSTTLIGDLNGDNKVNIFDLSILLSNWKKTNAAYELSQDEIIDISDLSVLLSNWTG